MSVDLAALKAALGRMTPGMWKVSTATLFNGEPETVVSPLGICVSEDLPREDADGIVLLRNAAPALIAEVERLRAENSTLMREQQQDAEERLSLRQDVSMLELRLREARAALSPTEQAPTPGGKA